MRCVTRMMMSGVLALTQCAMLCAQQTGDRESNQASSNTGTTSLMAQAYSADVEQSARRSDRPHAMRAVSLFAIEQPEPRVFQKHDLIQIIVREVSKAESTQELTSEKEHEITADVNAFPELRLSDLVNLQLMAGRTANLPQLDVRSGKEFEGEGEYEREDEFTARLTAEVIEVLPNGHLILEARTHIKTDEEEATMKVTGVCRPDDVTPANTVLSNQIHDLTIEKVHKGELKKANEKGIIAKVFDAVFAW